MTEYQEDIRDALKRAHGVDATYLETVPVREEFQGETVWAGDVEVFALHSHPKAAKAYAWSYQEGEDGKRSTRYITVLGLAPVDSAVMAVRVALASGEI